MPAESDDERDVSELAQEVIAELEPGTAIEDKVILSRRQVIGLTTGALSMGALATWATGGADAQTAAGQVGTSSEPIDVFAAGGGTVELEGDVTSTSVAGGYEVTIDGDTYEFND